LGASVYQKDESGAIVVRRHGNGFEAIFVLCHG
jgi:hypothetical protein